MSRTMKVLVAVVAAVVLALSIGVVAYAAGPNGNTNRTAVAQGYGCGLQGFGVNAVSDLLGMTPAEIQQLRLEGQSLVQIAATKGVTEAQLVAAIMEQKTAQVEARVTAGTLTREQADLMLQNMEQATIEAVNRTQTGPNGNGACGLGTGAGQGTARGGCGGMGAGGGMMRFGRAR